MILILINRRVLAFKILGLMAVWK